MRTNKEMVVMYMQDMTIKKGEDFKGFTTQELESLTSQDTVAPTSWKWKI